MRSTKYFTFFTNNLEMGLRLDSFFITILIENINGNRRKNDGAYLP